MFFFFFQIRLSGRVGYGSRLTTQWSWIQIPSAVALQFSSLFKLIIINIIITIFLLNFFFNSNSSIFLLFFQKLYLYFTLIRKYMFNNRLECMMILFFHLRRLEGNVSFFGLAVTPSLMDKSVACFQCCHRIQMKNR